MGLALLASSLRFLVQQDGSSRLGDEDHVDKLDYDADDELRPELGGSVRGRG
jgi:hypothetical protein